MDMPAEPLYAFGEGISYTKFTYSNPRIDKENLILGVDVTNTGKMDGIETVQVYFRDCVSSVMTPVKQLIAFNRIPLKAGETRNVEFRLHREDFSLVTPDEHRVTEPGDFIVMIGSSSRDQDLLKIKLTL
jgi:beta-glucosidase